LPAQAIYSQFKAASKKAVEVSKAAIANASAEQRERYRAMDEVSFIRLTFVSLLSTFSGWHDGG
jgi:hypothetical protein